MQENLPLSFETKSAQLHKPAWNFAGSISSHYTFQEWIMEDAQAGQVVCPHAKKIVFPDDKAQIIETRFAYIIYNPIPLTLVSVSPGCLLQRQVFS